MMPASVVRGQGQKDGQAMDVQDFAHEDGLEDMVLKLIRTDQDGEDDSCGSGAVGHQGDHDSQRSRRRGADYRYEAADEHEGRQRQGQWHLKNSQGEADDQGVDRRYHGGPRT